MSNVKSSRFLTCMWIVHPTCVLCTRDEELHICCNRNWRFTFHGPSNKQSNLLNTYRPINWTKLIKSQSYQAHYFPSPPPYPFYLCFGNMSRDRIDSIERKSRSEKARETFEERKFERTDSERGLQQWYLRVGWSNQAKAETGVGFVYNWSTANLFVIYITKFHFSYLHLPRSELGETIS